MPPKRKWREGSSMDMEESSSKIPKTSTKIEKLEVKKKDPKKDLSLQKKSGPPAKFIGKQYLELFKKVKSYAEKKALFENVVDEENYYRELFAQKRDAPELKDPYLLLVPAHDYEDAFKYVAPFEEEKKLPFVFPINKKQSGESCIVSKSEFERNFDIFTESQLRFLNWNNVFVAGGSVLACLQPPPGENNANNRTRRNYYHNLAYKSSDIDLFIYGLETEEEANKKLAEIYEAICESIPVTAICFRSTHAVTIISEYPYRHIQVILRLYKSPAEVLMGFDVDSCSVGYDGKKVWMTPRAHRALTHQYNAIDMTRRSPTYEQRLAKYGSRGFAVLVPSLERDKIDPQLFERRFDQLQGLARLILLETIATPEARTRYKDQQRLRRLRPRSTNQGGFLAQLSRQFTSEHDRERILDQGTSDASDYSTVFLPWGPKWNAEKIRKLMYTKDMILNSKWYDPNKIIHTHPCFFGTATEIVKDCCGRCPPVPPELEDPDSPFVSGKITWLMVNPGQQAQIGSFHPITEGDWTEGAYISSETEQLSKAINSNNLEVLTNYIRDGGDVNARDSVGRTALHLAVFANSVDSAALLLKNGARVSAKMIDGRTPLHIAATYGRTEILDLIIKRGKDLEIENQEKAKQREEEKKKAQKKDKKDKKEKKASKEPTKSKKKKEEEEEEEAEEMEEMEEEGEGEEEEAEEMEEEEGEDEDFVSIKQQVENKKKAQQENKELDPFAEELDDVFDINFVDWDLKMSACHYAIFFGHKACVVKLIENGATFNALLDGSLPLELALVNSQKDIAVYLLEKGVSINMRNQSYETILHCAARMKDEAFIKAILEWKHPISKEKIQINAFNNLNRTALHELLDVSRVSITEECDDPIDEEGFKLIKLLLKNGAKAHYTMDDWKEGRTQQQQQLFSQGTGSETTVLRMNVVQPIIFATQTGSKKLVELFLSEGADVNSFNSNGDTPLDIVDNWITSTRENDKNQTMDYNTQMKNFYKNQLFEYKKDTFAYNELELDLNSSNFGFGTYKTPRAKRNLKRVELNEQRQAIIKEKTIKLYKEISSFLSKKRGKHLLDIKLPSSETELQQLQVNRRNYSKSISSYNFTPKKINFFIISEPIPGIPNYGNRTILTEEESKYLEFYEAIWRGDVNTIEKLTIRQPIGKQVHVCCQTSLTHRTPLQIAILRNNSTIIKRLLEISVEQFTPFTPPNKQKKGDKVPLINNFDLMMAINLKPGRYLDPSGLPLDEKYEPLDPNAPVTQLNCITSPSALLKAKEKSGRNLLHIAGLLKQSESSVKALLAVIKEKKIVNQLFEYSDHPKHKSQESKDVITVLLLDRDSHSLTPFEIAIASGACNLAQIFLENKGIEINTLSLQEKREIYEGLDVGGKKMDWAKEHQAPQKTVYNRTPFHIAAAYDQEDSLNYLFSDSLKKTYQNLFPNNQEVASYFSPQQEDSIGLTPLHYATNSKASQALKTLIAWDKKLGLGLINKLDKSGHSALHMAASQGFEDQVQILLEGRADFKLTDSKRGWNPLHFAVWLGEKEPIQVLLKYVDKETINAASKKFKQTPLMVAAYYGRQEAIKLLLATQQVDLSLRDVGGDFALHHATKAQDLSSIQLLLPKYDPIYNVENGVGLTVVDCARQKLLLQRRSKNKCFDYLLQTQKDERIFVSTEDVRQITNIMVQIASEGQAQLTRKRRWYYEAEDDEAELTTGFVHDGTIPSATSNWTSLVPEPEEDLRKS